MREFRNVYHPGFGLMEALCGRPCDSQSPAVCAKVRYEAGSFCCDLQKDHKRMKIKSYLFTQRPALQLHRDRHKSDILIYCVSLTYSV